MERLRDHYHILRKINKGNYADVMLAQHLSTGMTVAVKVLPKGGNSDHIASEVNIMKSLQHPNVIRLLQVIETEEEVCMVMEYVSGGELLHHIRETSGLQEEEARRIFWQIICAIQYLHEQGIVHGDLKSNNILLDEDGTVKICDFGEGTKIAPEQNLNKICSPLPDTAQETLLCRRQLFAGDIWKLGVILYEVMAGLTPFKEIHPFRLKQQILQGRHYCPHTFSTDLQNLIGTLLTINNSQCPTLEEISRHPWLHQGKPPSPPPPDLLPECPKPEILKLMFALGHNPEEVKESLRLKKYDHRMATYLILERQARQGTGIRIRVKPANEGDTSSPDPTDATPSALLQSSGVPQPAPRNDAFLPGNQLDRKHELCTTAKCTATCQPCTESMSSSSCKERLCWQRVKRGIAGFVQKLCSCCLLSQKKNRVVPM
ncbi:Sperm motility kinase 2B [Fukomys damarensis]|uniref:non-specific serine/threonine protein kinase n=1 Tax=Fukomys damarensis TaxID=885580 RepID=A0A091E2Q1_FUKDA|nr:Sperm motility kinase 2B [Fukomys damarensis]